MQSNIFEIIAVTYGQNYELKCFINSIKCQTLDSWRLHIIHDGDCKNYQRLKKDLIDNHYLDHPNIFLSATPERYNDWGHSVRDYGLKNPISKSDYTIITNCDNYYIPQWMELIHKFMKKSGGVNIKYDFMYWDFVSRQSLANRTFDRITPYGLCHSKLKYAHIDMGCAAIKTSICQQVGFNHRHHDADWSYFEDCLKLCKDSKIAKIPSIFLVHN